MFNDDRIMNLIESETPYKVVAIICGCKERGKSVSYRVLEN